MLNGVDVAALRDSATAAKADPKSAERRATLRAKWLGADRALADIEGKTIEVGGPDRMDAMQLVLAAFAGCEIEVVAARAALMGLVIESIEMEIDARFDLRAYFGVEGPRPGYEGVAYVMRLRAPAITREQMRELENALERSSPVGATLAERVPLSSRLEIVPD